MGQDEPGPVTPAPTLDDRCGGAGHDGFGTADGTSGAPPVET